MEENREIVCIFCNSSNGRVGCDKMKARCFNCQQLGHFKRECTAPPAQQSGYPSTSNAITSAPSTSNSTALVSQHGTTGEGYDWSFQAEEHKALMADV